MVHEGVARAAVPAAHIPCGCQHAQIGNATDVEDGYGGVGSTENPMVKRWNQRSALAAGCQIACAEVRHHIDATELGQQSRIVQLQGVARAVVQEWLVTHGLAVGANRGDAGGRCACIGQQLCHDGRIGAGQAVGCQRSLVQLVWTALVQAEQ